MSAGLPNLLDSTAVAELERDVLGVNPQAKTRTGQVLGISPDPMRPEDIQIPSFMQSMPPACPKCNLLLECTNTNGVGDLLFVCQNWNCGYEAVWRKETNDWDQRAGVRLTDWVKPGTVTLTKGQTREARQQQQVAKLRGGEVEGAETEQETAGAATLSKRRTNKSKLQKGRRRR
jgi:hypothetical protein